ncbi:MAG: hypothetical protein ACMUIA_05215 [bacterium]
MICNFPGKQWKVIGAFFLLLVFIAVGHIMGIGNMAPSQILAGERVSQKGAGQERMIDEGRQIFRFDTFGSEEFWGGKLRLHEAIAQVSPKTALAVGLKVDVDAVPRNILNLLKQGKVDLDDPANTFLLLKINSVVGVTGFFNEQGNLSSIGIQCCLCHSTVDDSFAPGIGHRLDGWPNQDLNIGAIVALSPDLSPVAELLQVDEESVRAVLHSWGPGMYDAQYNMDSKFFRPDEKSAATRIPAAYGLAGVNLHTWTGWGSVPYWNAYVANTQMYGKGTFVDIRLNDPAKYPTAARTGLWDVRHDPDLITSKLPALHLYQISLSPPAPSEGSFDKEAAARGEDVFAGKGNCVECHVPPLFTEPGFHIRTPEEIGIDDFQSGRSPQEGYRTAPLRGLWSRMKRGFFHNGRFATLLDVVNHYNTHKGLGLTKDEKHDLVEYLKSL